MKIGILTQPLHDNYGGLLQAYALKTTLENLGHKVDIINRRRYDGLSFKIKNFVKSFSGKKTIQLSKRDQDIISQNTVYFRETYIKDITQPLYSSKDLKAIMHMYDAFVVGSDQVWRPRYSPQISNFFLDFLSDYKPIGLAYAASFGVENWEYSEKQTKLCKSNIHRFKAISVRENSGVKLCRGFLGADSVHVLDPTMLLTPEDYIKIIEQENEPDIKGDLVHYILDINPGKKKLVENISSLLDLIPVSSTRKEKLYSSTTDNINDCIYPKVTAWLKGFKDAKFIITDSFHGTVFSILFNKPFLVVANESRGRARFDSLLSLFGLGDRIIDKTENSNIEEIVSASIDWVSVNQQLIQKRKESMEFLTSNL